MKDRLGNDLYIGDLCICYNNMGTGSSTRRLVQYEGEIVRFTPKLVKVKCVQCSYSEKNGNEFTVDPDNIFKINFVRHGKWIEKPFLMGTTNECSVCKDFFGMPHGKYNFCPTCGAKMDLEG